MGKRLGVVSHAKWDGNEMQINACKSQIDVVHDLMPMPVNLVSWSSLTWTHFGILTQSCHGVVWVLFSSVESVWIWLVYLMLIRLAESESLFVALIELPTQLFTVALLIPRSTTLHCCKTVAKFGFLISYWYFLLHDCSGSFIPNGSNPKSELQS